MVTCIKKMHLVGKSGESNGDEGGIVISGQAHKIIMCLYNIFDCCMPVGE
jgi:hypothetical protein